MVIASFIWDSNSEKEEKMNQEKKKLKAMGVWSMIGTWILLLIVAWNLIPFSQVCEELLTFASGRVMQLQAEDCFQDVLGICLWIVVISLLLCFTSGIVFNKIAGKAKGHFIEDLFNLNGERRFFLQMFLAVLLEELFARGLFLGLLTKIPFLSGALGFYFLMFLGNAIWSVIHIRNFKRAQDKNFIRTIPQFVCGLFLSFVFVKYGLLGAILVHFGFNAVILSLNHKQRFNKVDLCIILLNVVYMLAAYLLMQKPLTDVLVWLNGSGDFKLPGWNFFDYLCFSIFLSSCFTLIFDLLLYDRSYIDKKIELDQSLLVYVIVFLIILLLTLGITYGAYFLLGLVIKDIPIRVLIISLAFCGAMKSPSLSSAMRFFWCSVPGTFVFIHIINAIGFFGALAYVSAVFLLGLPGLFLLANDD